MNYGDVSSRYGGGTVARWHNGVTVTHQVALWHRGVTLAHEVARWHRGITVEWCSNWHGGMLWQVARWDGGTVSLPSGEQVHGTMGTVILLVLILCA